MANDPIPGRATPEGTSRFTSRHTDNLSEHYRTVESLSLSDLGIGTFLGRPDEETDRRFTDAVVRAVERGVNVIDTAINYRFQRSERAVGEAIRRLVEDRKISRDEIVVCTKGGYLPFENEPPKNPMDWLDENLFETGVIVPGDIVADCHCLEPAYLRHQIQASRKNLGLGTIDIYYLHNVETQLAEISKSELDEKLRTAFETLEDEVDEGRIARYGLATWDGFRVAPDEPQHHSLTGMLKLAHSVAGEQHHFKAIQFPFNLLLREAATRQTQEWQGDRVALLRLVHDLGLIVMGSAPLLQGKLLGKLPAPLSVFFPTADNDAQRALLFASGAPGLTSALVGMSQASHVDQNTETLRQRRLDPSTWRKVLDALK
jgi:aryl-alcohol dehydrogenase-like predicted oxidoreductase